MRRVSRAARPAGVAPRRSSSSHKQRRKRGFAEQLDAILAGVAGTADEHLRAGQAPRGGAHARRQRRVGDALHGLARQRPLHGEHRVALGRIAHLDLGERARLRAKPLEVALVV